MYKLFSHFDGVGNVRDLYDQFSDQGCLALTMDNRIAGMYDVNRKCWTVEFYFEDTENDSASDDEPIPNIEQLMAELGHELTTDNEDELETDDETEPESDNE